MVTAKAFNEGTGDSNIRNIYVLSGQVIVVHHSHKAGAFDDKAPTVLVGTKAFSVAFFKYIAFIYPLAVTLWHSSLCKEIKNETNHIKREELKASLQTKASFKLR